MQEQFDISAIDELRVDDAPLAEWINFDALVELRANVGGAAERFDFDALDELRADDSGALDELRTADDGGVAPVLNCGVPMGPPPMPPPRPPSDHVAQREILERAAGHPMSNEAASCMLLSPMAFALEQIPRRGAFGPHAVAWRAIRVLEAVAAPGNMDRELAYIVEWGARVVAEIMTSCDDEDAAGAATAFAVIGTLEDILVLDRPAAPRPSPRFARAPPTSGQDGFYAAFLEMVRESTNCSTFLMTNKVQGASGTNRHYCWSLGVAILGFIVRCLRDSALGDRVSGSDGACAITDTPTPSVSIGTFDVSGIAPSVAAMARGAILYNTPLHIARGIKTYSADRCAIERRARETGGLFAGWLSTFQCAIGGDRVINLAQYNCHDPARPSGVPVGLFFFF